MRAKRGRPLKFGRPTQLLTISLPADVVAWLKHLDPDPAWAIVSLFEKAQRRAATGPLRVADLVQLPGKRALILVKPDVFAGLNGRVGHPAVRRTGLPGARRRPRARRSRGGGRRSARRRAAGGRASVTRWPRCASCCATGGTRACASSRERCWWSSSKASACRRGRSPTWRDRDESRRHPRHLEPCCRSSPAAYAVTLLLVGSASRPPCSAWPAQALVMAPGVAIVARLARTGPPLAARAHLRPGRSGWPPPAWSCSACGPPAAGAPG